MMNDPRYGSDNKNTEGLQLQAAYLQFIVRLAERSATTICDEMVSRMSFLLG